MARKKSGDRIKRGKYEIKVHPSGAFTVYPPGKQRGTPIHPPEEVKQKCLEMINNGSESLPLHLKKDLGYIALLHMGKRSVPLGKQFLGIKGPYKKTKTRKVLNGVAVPLEDIQKAIKWFWTPKEVELWKKGKSLEFSAVNEFRKKFEREYASAHNIRGGLRNVFEQVYPPEEFPGLYNRVCKRSYVSEISEKRLGKWFKKRVEKGLPVSQSYLRHSTDSEEKLAYRQTLQLVKTQRGLIHMNFDDVVVKISGADKEDIESSKGSRTPMAKLSEELAYFFFVWADLMKLPIGKHAPLGKIYKTGHEIMFEYNDKHRQADLRIGNKAIEVKSGVTRFKEDQLQGMIGRYTPNENYWLTGEPISSSTVFFHSKPEFYKHCVPTIRDVGIQIIDYRWFGDKLKKLVKRIKNNYLDQIRDVKPRIADLDYILDLDNELVNNPFLLMRPSNKQRRDWSKNLLRNLAVKGVELKYGK